MMYDDAALFSSDGEQPKLPKESPVLMPLLSTQSSGEEEHSDTSPDGHSSVSGTGVVVPQTEPKAELLHSHLVDNVSEDLDQPAERKHESDGVPSPDEKAQRGPIPRVQTDANLISARKTDEPREPPLQESHSS
jgi:hypothetical protein